MSKPKEVEVPDFLRDYITRSSFAMEKIAQVMEEQHTDWNLISNTLNSSFLVHNTKTEELCKAIAANTEEAKLFRTDAYSYSQKHQDAMWDLVKKLVLVMASTVVAIAAGVATLKLLLPVLGG
jgi:hypothetical protein